MPRRFRIVSAPIYSPLRIGDLEAGHDLHQLEDRKRPLLTCPNSTKFLTQAFDFIRTREAQGSPKSRREKTRRRSCQRTDQSLAEVIRARTKTDNFKVKPSAPFSWPRQVGFMQTVRLGSTPTSMPSARTFIACRLHPHPRQKPAFAANACEIGLLVVRPIRRFQPEVENLRGGRGGGGGGPPPNFFPPAPQNPQQTVYAKWGNSGRSQSALWCVY